MILCASRMCYKYQRLGHLKQQRTFLTVLEAGSPRSGWQHNQVLIRTLLQVQSGKLLIYPPKKEEKKGRRDGERDGGRGLSHSVQPLLIMFGPQLVGLFGTIRRFVTGGGL